MNIIKQAQFCPRCGSHSLSKNEKRIQCAECDFSFYLNSAAATGVLMYQEDQLLCVKRNKEPGFGLYDFPGGFADPGETLELCAAREIREELSLEIKSDNLEYLFSYPNTYHYKETTYYVLDVFFTAPLPNGTLILDKEEIADAVLIPANEIKKEKLAFESHKLALDVFCKRKGIK